MRAVRKAIAFIKKAKLQNPDIISDSDVRMEQMAELDQVYRDILKSLGGTAGSVAGGVGVGALTAMGTYGLVGAFGTASTGAAIGGLSGAAASSATLAWFGGGAVAAGGLGIAAGTAVLGGIVAVPAVVAFGVFKKHEADKLEKEVDRKVQGLKLEEAKIARDRAKLLATRQRADELRRTITRFAKELRTVLRNSNPDQDEDVYRVVQLAKSLRTALDEPVIEPPQKLSQKENPKREVRTNLGRPVKLRPNERIEMARYPSEQCADGKMRQRCQNKRTRGYYCPLHGSA